MTFREWLAGQRTTTNPFVTGITAADLTARIAASYTGWTSADELHRVLHSERDLEPWVCEALAEASDEYDRAGGC